MTRKREPKPQHSTVVVQPDRSPEALNAYAQSVLARAPGDPGVAYADPDDVTRDPLYLAIMTGLVASSYPTPGLHQRAVYILRAVRDASTRRAR